MESGNTIPAPQSVAEAEQLVKRLYQPGPARIITQINDQLQQLQTSQDGWRLADELMSSDDTNVRFFAALTFMVKLNNDWHSVDEETALAVQKRLIAWLIRLINQGEGALVCKKMCSVLTRYFLQSPVSWEHPLRHLTMCFHRGDVVSENDEFLRDADMSKLLPTLSHPQLKVLLWFAGTLAEEIGRLDSTSRVMARSYSGMEKFVEDASAIIHWSLGQSISTNGSPPTVEALSVFLTWVNYAQPNWPQNPEALQHLRNLIEPAARCILQESTFREALDIFRDVLESYSSFFRTQHLEMIGRIIHDHVRPNLLRALSEKDPDSLVFGQFIIAFGCANIQHVVEQTNDEVGSIAIVKSHLDILSTDGYPGDEDQLSILNIEFWNTYIEYVNDTRFSKDQDEPDPSWLSQAKNILQQTVELLWKKLFTPTSEIAKEWGDAERESFKEFRLDSTDLMLSIFLLLGKDMLHQLVAFTLQSLELKQWRAVEAALFCLNALADNVLEDMAEGEVIGEIFRSNLFSDIADFSQNVPPQTCRTAIDLLGSYGQYIERHAEFLPQTVRFLFASLEAGSLANSAAKSIASLCYTCRANLTGDLQGFLDQYERFLSSKTSDPYTKEKVIGAIAAIIQALSPESAKAQPLLALIANVENDIAATKQYADVGDEEMVELMGISALECLASIGKAMQVPEDVPIDIYDDEEEKRATESSYWHTNEGQAVQQRIVGCFSVLQLVGNYGPAVDAACQVLRSGFTETVPGPFVLPPSVIVNFVQQCTVTTPQAETVLATAAMLITQHSRHDSKRVDTEVAAIYGTVVEFSKTLGQSSNDPVMAQACIDVLIRLMPYYTPVLLGNMMTPSILDFALSAIEGAETLPKRSSCEFWSKLMKPQTAVIPPGTQQRMAEVIAAFGPKLATCLMRQVGGQAQRSDLDSICEPFRAILVHQPNAQKWLLESNVELTPFAQLSAEELLKAKTTWVRQTSRLSNDGKKFKDAIRQMWAACRGTLVGY